MKLTRKRSTGKPYAAFDEAGAGNGLKGTAPVLDPTMRAGRAGNRYTPSPYWAHQSSGKSKIYIVAFVFIIVGMQLIL